MREKERENDREWMKEYVVMRMNETDKGNEYDEETTKI